MENPKIHYPGYNSTQITAVKENNPKKRINVLDSLRGIAALSVVFFHYTQRFRGLYGHEYSKKYDFSIGHYGVELFFIISGFVIFMTVEKCKDANDFAFRRFTRLFPTYWLCLLLTFTVLFFLGDPSQKVGFATFLANMTMLEKFMHVKYVDGAYWSLVPELIFYIAMYFLIKLNWVKKVYLWGPVWLGISLLASILKVPYHELFLKYAGLFFSGIIFYKIHKGQTTITNYLLISTAYIIVLVNYREQPYSIYVISFIYALFYCFVFNKLSFLNNKVLNFLGFISYPLYLIHQQLGYVILNKLKAVHIDTVWATLIPVCIFIFVAYIIFQYFEKPVIKRLRSYIEPKLNQLRYKSVNKIPV